MFKANKICQLLNIKYPILQGGMAWASDSILACAVSDAGGFGIIGCGGRKFEWVLNEIANAKKISSQSIGLNIPLEGLSDNEAEHIIEIAISIGKNIFTVSGSNSYLKFLSKYGDDALIIPVVGNVMEAKLAERRGAKAVICEGQESGGSIGRLSLFSLLPQVVDAINIPVIAAGGIADSRGMTAAFALGAQGIQMGTRFLASNECSIIDEYKKRILKAKDIDSIVIFNKVKYPARVIKNKFAMEYLSKERDDASQDELIELGKGSLKLAVESDVDGGAMHAGEISGLIHDIKSTREIIEDIVLGFLNDSDEYVNDNEVRDTEVSKFLKHKPPILLVDKILKLKPGVECRASLKLNKDKWFFKCHYPDYPVMPGTLLLEAMSQTMTLIVTSMEEFGNDWGERLLLSSISNVKFVKEAIPGLKLIMSANIDSFKRGIVKGDVKCEANGELICSCVMTIVIPNALNKLSNQIRRDK